MKLISSQSVSIGHPDKVSDQISDAILDQCLKQNKDAHVGCQCLCTTNKVVLAGQITKGINLDVDCIVRKILKDIGYDFEGFDYKTVSVQNYLHEQSQNIAVGVNERLDHQQGAGDQGMMFGYAEDNQETNYMPIPIYYAHKIMSQFVSFRKNDQWGEKYLKPDAKCQLTFDFQDEQNPILKSVIISHQHVCEINKKELIEKSIEIIKNVIPEKYHNNNFQFISPDEKCDYNKNITYVYINPTGSFVIGGPDGDTGLTGRKIVVDTYGGIGHVGGGAFSGKDSSKVDRSSAYMCRYVAKHLVRNKMCKKCQVSVAYAIGVANPVQISVNSFGTANDDYLTKYVKDNFDFRPKSICDLFKLKQPNGWNYQQTAMNGHFGNDIFPWQKQ